MQRTRSNSFWMALAALMVFGTGGVAIAEDCNGNGIEDACDLDCGPAGGACDVAGCGGSVDCQPNGILDECETESGVPVPFVLTSGPLSPLPSPLPGGEQFHVFPSPPAALGDVTLSFEAVGDLDDDGFEAVRIRLKGCIDTPNAECDVVCGNCVENEWCSIGNVFFQPDGGSACTGTPDFDSVPVAACLFNRVVGANGDNLEIMMDPTNSVSACSGSYIAAEVSYTTAEDCNTNGTPDACEYTSGRSADCNGNGVSDLCEGPSVAPLGGRYLDIRVLGPDLDPNLRYALDVYPESLGCQERCVQSDGTLGIEPCVLRTPSEWCRVLVHGEIIIPGPYAPGTPQNYAVVARAADQGVPWVTLGSADMPVWGDVGGLPEGGVWAPPDGKVNLADILAVLVRFANAPGAPPVEQVDIGPPLLRGDCAEPDGRADFIDVTAILHAFAHLSYPCRQPCFGG